MYVSFKQAVHQLYKSCAFAGDCRERCPLSATLLLHCSEVAMTCLHTQSHSLCLHAQSGQALHLKCAGLWLWSLVQVAFSVSNLIAQAVCGLHVKPGMQLPIASDSLQDFWGRRWNQPTSNVLRAVCHKPVLAALEARGAASHRHDSNTTTSHESGMLQADHVVTRAQARALRATQTQSAAEAHHDGTQRSSSSSHMSRKRSSTPRQTLSNGNTSQAAAPQVQPSVQSRRKLWHRACAMTWSFAVSGVMHHWMFVMLTGCSIKDVRWAMALLVQPFLIALQQAMQGSKLWRSFWALDISGQVAICCSRRPAFAKHIACSDRPRASTSIRAQSCEHCCEHCRLFESSSMLICLASAAAVAPTLYHRNLLQVHAHPCELGFAGRALDSAHVQALQGHKASAVIHVRCDA
jgi:hypothetical protein